VSNFHSTFSNINIYHSAQSATNTTTPCLCWCDTRSSISAAAVAAAAAAHCWLALPLTRSPSLPHSVRLSVWLSVCLAVCVLRCGGWLCRRLWQPATRLIADWRPHTPDTGRDVTLTVAVICITLKCRNQAWIKTNLTEDEKERFKCESVAVIKSITNQLQWNYQS